MDQQGGIDVADASTGAGSVNYPPGASVYDADGEKLGTVSDRQDKDDFLLAHKGRLFGHDVYIPRAATWRVSATWRMWRAWRLSLAPGRQVAASRAGPCLPGGAARPGGVLERRDAGVSGECGASTPCVICFSRASAARRI